MSQRVRTASPRGLIDRLEPRLLYSVVDGTYTLTGATGDPGTIVVTAAKYGADGSLFVGGADYAFLGFPVAFVAKFAPDGQLDPTFNGGTPDYFGGIANHGYSRVFDLAVADDGTVAVVGDADLTLLGERHPFQTRLLQDGSVDPFVGVQVRANSPEWSNSVVLQPDGGIAVADMGFFSNNQLFSSVRGYRAFDYGVDTFFGTNGSTTGTLPFSDVAATKLIELSDGSLALAGSIRQSGHLDYVASVAGFTSSGIPTAFFTVDDPTSSNEYTNNLTIQPDGKIVGVGTAEVGGVNQFFVFRLNTDGSPDLTFQGRGHTRIDLNPNENFNDQAYAVTVLADGEIMVAGLNGSNFAVVALDSSGNIDRNFANQGAYIDTSSSASSLVNTRASNQLPLGFRLILASLNDGSGVFAHSDSNGRTKIERLNFDSVAPTASVRDLAAPTVGTATYDVFVDYGDNIEVAAASIAGSALTITGPNGFSTTAQFVSQTQSSDKKTAAALYRFSAPGGTWDASDNGSYTISVPATVRDGTNNLVGAISATLGVNLTGGTTVPPPPASPPPPPANAPLSGELKASVPASGIAGQKGKISGKVTVRNALGSDVEGLVTVRLVLSTDGTVSTDDSQVGAQTRSVRLHSGKGKSFSIKTSSIPLVAAGIYNLLAEVLAPDGTQSAVVVGSAISIASPFVDLALSSPVNPISGEVSDRKSTSVRLTNAGNISASGTVTLAVRLTLNGVTQTISTSAAKIKLKPGKGKTLKSKFTLPNLAVGTYTIDFIVDGSSLADSTISNNDVSGGSFTVF